MGPAPIVSLASSQVASLSISMSISSMGKGFSYSQLDSGIRQLLDDDENMIKMCFIYQSPVQSCSSNNSQGSGLFTHKEIILKIETSYVLFSFGIDGLENGVGSLQKIVNRRRNNKQSCRVTINKSVSYLRRFLKNVEDKKYHLVFWNCITFSTEMLRTLKN